MRPSKTQRGAHTDLVVAASELRDFLGLFSDTSQDTLIEELSAGAQEKIGNFLGYPVGVVPVTDYYLSLIHI